jgi:hypothetical protein
LARGYALQNVRHVVSENHHHTVCVRPGSGDSAVAAALLLIN